MRPFPAVTFHRTNHEPRVSTFCRILLLMFAVTSAAFGQHPYQTLPVAGAPGGSAWGNFWPSLRIWDVNNVGQSPSVGLDLYTSSNSLLGASLWGVAFDRSSFTAIGSAPSSITDKQDVVINAADARDLIITNRSVVSSGTDYGAIRFGTTPAGSNTQTDLERMTILNNGYVGIGTNAPKNVLHLHKAALQVSNADENGQLLTIGQLCVAPGNSLYSSLARKGDVVFRMFNYDSSATENKRDIIISAHTDKGGIRFATGDRTDVERLTIFHDGNIVVKGSETTVFNLGFNFGVNGGNAAVRAKENFPALMTLMPYGQGSWWNLANVGDGSKLVIATGDVRGENDGSSYWTTNSKTKVVVTSDGNVGIGIANPAQKLVVNGTVCAKEVRVSTASGGVCGWPDYVFSDTFKLRPLGELEEYVRQNRHLPDIPSAVNVAADGILLGEMQVKLLQKVEELTLYVIDLKKDNQKIQSELQELKARSIAPNGTPH